MCTLEEMEERLQLLHDRLSENQPLFPGGPVVQHASVRKLFDNESLGRSQR